MIFILGDRASNSGSHSVYVSRNNLDPIYNINNASRTHAGIYIDIPAGATNINISFTWKGEGERNYDFMRVFMLDGNGNNQVIIGESQYGGESSWRTDIINLPNSVAGTRRKFEFEWRNDGNTGSQTPFIMDDFKLKCNL